MITQQENSFSIISCSLSSGSNPITFTWRFNSQPLEKDSDFAIETSDRFSQIKLPQVKKSQSGNYTCLAKNSFGIDSISVKLIVNGEICYYFNVSKLN